VNDFTEEELAACDWTKIVMGPRGIEYRSGKTGKLLFAPLPSPADQIRAQRLAAGKEGVK
jgi:hypothetical protein